MALDSQENPTMAQAAAADYNGLLDPNQFALARGTRHESAAFPGVMAQASGQDQAQTAQDFDYDEDDFETYDDATDEAGAEDTLDEDDMAEPAQAAGVQGAAEAETTLVASD